MCFCTRTYYVSVLELIFSYLNKYFCTGIYNSVLEQNLYWNIYCCTEKHICVLEYKLQYWNVFFLYWNIYCCTEIDIIVLEVIFLYCPCAPTQVRLQFQQKTREWTKYRHCARVGGHVTPRKHYYCPPSLASMHVFHQLYYFPALPSIMKFEGTT